MVCGFLCAKLYRHDILRYNSKRYGNSGMSIDDETCDRIILDCYSKVDLVDIHKVSTLRDIVRAAYEKGVESNKARDYAKLAMEGLVNPDELNSTERSIYNSLHEEAMKTASKQELEHFAQIKAKVLSTDLTQMLDALDHALEMSKRNSWTGELTHGRAQMSRAWEDFWETRSIIEKNYVER